MRTWEAYADGTLKHRDWPVEQHANPIVGALGHHNLAEPQRIEVYGDHTAEPFSCTGLYLGTKSQCGGNYASGALFNVEIVGKTPDATIGPIFVDQRFGTVEGLTFRDLTINASNSRHGIIFAMGQEHRDFTIKDCTVLAGYQTKWGVRAHGPVESLHVEGLVGSDLQEHLVYADNVSGGCVVKGCVGNNCKRTGVQIVNREDSGESGSGAVVISRNVFTDCGEHGGGGITVAGHLEGPVLIRGNKVTSEHDTYACVVWREGPKPSVGKIGAWTDPEGYAVEEVAIWRNEFDVPNTKRGVVAVSSSREVHLGPNKYGTSGKPDVWVDHPYGGGPPCGSLRLRGRGKPSGWSGWSGGPKVQVGAEVLSGDALDALWGKR